MISSRLPRFTAPLLTAALLAACGQPVSPPAPAAVYRPARVAEVAVTSSDTASGLEARYGGRVVVFDPRAGYAILGFDAASPERLGAQALGDAVQDNLGRFEAEGMVGVWAGGMVGVWAGGMVGVWAGGMVGVWAGGVYTPFPQNTTVFQKIGLDAAQAKATNRGAGVKVAVVDTGVDLNHTGLQGALAPASEWKDFVDGDALPQDEGTLGNGAAGHGTAVAGLVLQVAPGATILPLRVLSADGSGDALSVAQAIDYAVSKGANVINLSLGSDARLAVVKSAIDRATAAGVYVVSSGGNDNRNGLTYPAADADLGGPAGDYALSVGSVNALDVKSGFANYANDLELSAPGEAIYTFAPGDRVAPWSGTSMSAPLASGGVALALGESLRVARKDVPRKMKDSAFDLYKLPLNSGYKDLLGKGRLDLKKFLDAAIR